MFRILLVGLTLLMCSAYATENSVEGIKKAVESGDAAAQNNLGMMYDNGEGVPVDAVDEPLSEPFKNLQTALLFCPEEVSVNECKKVTNNEIYYHYLVGDYRSKLPSRVQDIAKASVRFRKERDGYLPASCTGTVIRLKKGNKSCGNKLHLFTAGHCVMWKKEEGVFFPTEVTISTTSDGIDPDYVLSFLENPEDLYKSCKAYFRQRYYVKECLVDHNNFQSREGRSDQALLPFSSQNLPLSIKPLEIDIEKVASLEEVDMCLEKGSQTGYFSPVFKHRDAIIFGLDDENEANLGSKVFQCRVYDELTKSYAEKSRIRFRCPVVGGFSGTLGYMKCHQKEAFFLAVSDRPSRGYGKEAKDNLPIPYPSETGGGWDVLSTNQGMRLNSQFLKFYFERVCEGKGL